MMKNDQYQYLLQKLNIRNELRNIIKMQQKVEERIVECINRIDGQLKLDVPNKEKPLEEEGKNECGGTGLSHLGAPYVPPHRYGKTTKNEEVSETLPKSGPLSMDIGFDGKVAILDVYKLRLSHKDVDGVAKYNKETNTWKAKASLISLSIFDNSAERVDIECEDHDLKKVEIEFQKAVDEALNRIEAFEKHLKKN